MHADTEFCDTDRCKPKENNSTTGQLISALLQKILGLHGDQNKILKTETMGLPV